MTHVQHGTTAETPENLRNHIGDLNEMVSIPNTGGGWRPDREADDLRSCIAADREWIIGARFAIACLAQDGREQLNAAIEGRHREIRLAKAALPPAPLDAKG